jgi:RNA polymerase sigma factor (sigma-70 family)
MNDDVLKRGVDAVPRVGAAAASRAEIEELFVSCEGGIGRFLVQMVFDRELAEDLLQDVFHDALRGRRSLAQADNPTAWLYGIARNHALKALRRRRRARRATDLLATKSRLNPCAFDEELVVVRDLLERSLSPNDRVLVLLRYLHGFDAVELAELTGQTPAAVRQRLSRARRALVEAAGMPTEEFGWEEQSSWEEA